MTEVEFEEQSMSKITLIILCILSAIVFAFILYDIMTGGSIIKSIICPLVWSLPGIFGPMGKFLPSYIGCNILPI